MLGGRDAAEHTVACYHLESPHPVGSQPKRTRQGSDPAAGGVAHDPDVPGGAVQRRQTVRRGGLDHPQPLHAGPHPSPALGVHGDLVQIPGGDQQVPGQRADRTVPGRLDAHGQAVPGREPHRLHDVLRAAGLHQRGGCHGDGQVPWRGQSLVRLAARLVQLTVESVARILQRGSLPREGVGRGPGDGGGRGGRGVHGVLQSVMRPFVLGPGGTLRPRSCRTLVAR